VEHQQEGTLDMIRAIIQNEEVGTQNLTFPVMPLEGQRIEINEKKYVIRSYHWRIDGGSPVLLVVDVQPAVEARRKGTTW
jgi:hypothetical protein